MRKFIAGFKGIALVMACFVLAFAFMPCVAFAASEGDVGTYNGQDVTYHVGSSAEGSKYTESGWYNNAGQLLTANDSAVIRAKDTGNDDLFDRAGSILNTIKSGLLKISGAAVIIAVGCGVFMKKFSMGKQDKIETGNKLIRDSIVGFVVLNSMTYIVSYIQQLTK